ncbi:uncharacterized protein SOCE836_012370 [Sorangium cellulosum]|uniref:Uncharacterized protein n=2 Tax=Polyangiaceae TaxID=49 RepID=A0A4P2QGZ6_SORCE|nr:uncharacterized protein SOCE836_012370 [Sorangium cellulosum]WCQ88541.1 hypothetical protein NQZ70_01220 [Sorangium sp. Soce836]
MYRRATELLAVLIAHSTRVFAWLGIVRMPHKRQVARLDTGTAGAEG